MPRACNLIQKWTSVHIFFRDFGYFLGTTIWRNTPRQNTINSDNQILQKRGKTYMVSSINLVLKNVSDYTPLLPFLPYVIILFVVLIRSILTFLQGYRGWQRGYTTAFCPDPNDFGQTIYFCLCFPWIKPLSMPAFECGVINMILATRNKRLKQKLFPIGLLIWFKWYHIPSILYSSEPSSYSAKITSERVFSGNSLT